MRCVLKRRHQLLTTCTPPAGAVAGDGGGGAEAEEEELRGAEASLLRDVETDPLAAYDVDVAEEGALLAAYLSRLPPP